MCLNAAYLCKVYHVTTITLYNQRRYNKKKSCICWNTFVRHGSDKSYPSADRQPPIPTKVENFFFSSLTPFIHLKSTQAVVIKVMLRVQPPILTHRIDHEKKWGRNIRMSWLDSIGKGIWFEVYVYLNVVRLKYLKIVVNLNIQRIQIFRTFGFDFNNRKIF